MANYATLKAGIIAAIKENGNNEITGNLLQQQLLAMVNSLGVGYQYAGIATPATNPGTPDQNVFYLASTAGTYANFGGLVLDDGEIAILKYNGVWSKDSTGAATKESVNQLGQELSRVFTKIIPSIKETGKYIDNNGSVYSAGGFLITNGITLKEGETIFVLCMGYATTVSIISEVVGNTYKPLVISDGNDEKFYSYTNYGNDKEIAICCKTSGYLVFTSPVAKISDITKYLPYLGEKQTVTIDYYGTDGYIEYTGNFYSQGGWKVSNPIPVTKGSIILFEAKGYAQNISMISKYNNSTSVYIPLVISNGNSTRFYYYFVEEDMQICTCQQGNTSALYILQNCIFSCIEEKYNIVKEDVASLKIDNDNNKKVTGYTTRIPSYTVTTGKYMDEAGRVYDAGGFAVSDSIPINKNELLIFNGEGYATNVTMIAIKRGSQNIPIEVCPDGTKRKYQYVAKENCNIVLSGKYSSQNPFDVIIVNGSYGIAKTSLETNADVPSIDGVDNVEKTQILNPIGIIKTSPLFVPIFRNWGFIGDSLCSGEMQCYDGQNVVYLDQYENSWGQQICRLCGSEGYNYSYGGQTTREWIDTTVGEARKQRNWYYAQQTPKQAYIIALGVNDYGSIPVGDVSTDVDMSDYNNNADTYAGNYFGIIQRLRSVSPRCKIFCVTMPDESKYSEYNAVIRQTALPFDNVYIIDLATYAPEINSAIRERYWNGGHLVPAGYLYMAYTFMTYIDWIIRNNWNSFKDVSLWETDYTLSPTT